MSEEMGYQEQIIVQELAAKAQEPPKLFLHDPRDMKQVVSEMPEPIPLIDLGRLPTADEADKFRVALQTWGLFLVTNHGMEGPLMDDAMKTTLDFFRLPLEEKQKCSILKDKEYKLEGYGNDELVSPEQIMDWSDMVQLIMEPHELRNPELWPARPESLRDVIHKFYERTSRMKDQIMVAVAKLLELDEDYFAAHVFTGNTSALARLNYYPPCVRPDRVLGFKPHSDASIITFLSVDQEVGGLQVERDGKWYNVPRIPHTLVVFLGDAMEIVTNGAIRSPVHRVVTNSMKERISLAMFYGPDLEELLEPLPEFLDEKSPSKFRPIKFNDFINHTPDLGKRQLDMVKIQAN